MKRKFGILALFSVLTLIITSCGGSTPAPTPTPDFSIAVSNAAPSIEEGATADVTVTITPSNGFSDQVALTINDPADVTATFNPASTATTSVLTLGSATAGSYPMTVTATAGTITKTAGVTLTVTGSTAPPPPATSTISGKVLDTENQPVANIAVVILGQDAARNVLSTTAITGLTNANGEFTIAGVKKPYDVAVISNNGGIVGNISTIYMGLSKDDPTLFLVDAFGLGSGAAKKEAKFNGETLGSNLPSPTNQHNQRGVFGSPEVLQPFNLNNSGIYRDIDTSSSNVDVEWFGPNTTDGMIHVLQWKEQSTTNPLPLSFTGYANRTTTLADQSTANDQDVTLTNLGSGNAGGTITLPTGFVIDEKIMSVELDTNSRLEFASETNNNVNFNYVTPQINGSTLSLAVFTTNPDGRSSNVLRSGLGLNDTSINVNVPDAPSLVLPVNNAQNITHNTEFQWAPFGFTNSVNVVQAFSLAGNAFIIVTEDSKVKIPDLSAFGIELAPPIGPSGTVIPHFYKVTSVGPVSDVNAAASSNFVDLFSGNLLNSDMALGNSQQNLFGVVVP